MKQNSAMRCDLAWSSLEPSGECGMFWTAARCRSAGSFGERERKQETPSSRPERYGVCGSCRALVDVMVTCKCGLD